MRQGDSLYAASKGRFPPLSTRKLGSLLAQSISAGSPLQFGVIFIRIEEHLRDAFESDASLSVDNENSEKDAVALFFEFWAEKKTNV